MMTRKEALMYEVSGAGWPGYISFNWIQVLIARYFAYKTNKKYDRYKKFVENVKCNGTEL